MKFDLEKSDTIADIWNKVVNKFEQIIYFFITILIILNFHYVFTYVRIFII